jgi:hypothetical protein
VFSNLVGKLRGDIPSPLAVVTDQYLEDISVLSPLLKVMLEECYGCRILGRPGVRLVLGILVLRIEGRKDLTTKT